MRIAGRFLVRLVAWAGGFLGIMALVLLLSGGREEVRLLHAINWLAGALTLAAFPAGIAVADEVVRWTEPRLRPFLLFAAAAGLIGLLVIGVRGYLGPALVRAGEPPGAADRVEVEAAAIYLHDRPAALRQAYAAAEARPAAAVAAWRAANRLGWNLDGTIVGGLMAAVFAWIGCLFGGWVRCLERPELGRAAYWALGLFLLVSTYLMTENSYEFIVIHMAGPALFAAWLPLIGPGMLLVGLAIPTVVAVASRPGSPPA